MRHICSVNGCYGNGRYYSDKCDWFCEEHKPEKLFDYSIKKTTKIFTNINETIDEEIITTVKIKHNTCYKSIKEAEEELKNLLRLDGYRVID